MKLYDVIIIGGGPAGLNAAVVLGRCRRTVLLFDTGKQRNRFSNGLRNYLTRDNILPTDFIKLANQEIKKYGVFINRLEVVEAEKLQTDIFAVKDKTGSNHYSKKLLIATGLRDNIPLIEGIEFFYGKSVFHCPYCDGWEVKDRDIGVYAKNKNGFEMAISLKTWSKQVTIFTDGRNYLKPLEKEELKKKSIKIIAEKIVRLEGKNGRLTNIIFNGYKKQHCDALFFVNGYGQQCDIAKSLGCRMNKKGIVITNRLQQADIPGLYVAGDASKDVQFVVVAAAEGAKAGVSINKELQKEDFKGG
ncbi:MAG TPA: NAD(P)/FAD-dependent oxidoreductase [Chitinophagaceae bacterium]|jgi:thioredoxin reductase|nr:NAD(P)/FAD-dependent oxidoreductase [Chitinophagaceae bacterium]